MFTNISIKDFQQILIIRRTLSLSFFSFPLAHQHSFQNHQEETEEYLS